MVESALTLRQHEVLAFLRWHWEEKGRAPTMREIGKKLGVSSLATVHKHLAGLREKGLIRWRWNAKRGIYLNERVYPAGWQPIGTAPKDGTRFLVADKDREITIGQWDRDEGYHAWRDDEWERLRCEPTHWMPLPDPPGAGEAREGAAARYTSGTNEVPGEPVTICPACIVSDPRLRLCVEHEQGSGAAALRTLIEHDENDTRRDGLPASGEQRGGPSS